MRLNIAIGGKAGEGINKLAEVVSSSLVRAGLFVFNYKDYQSLIKGGHNFNILSVSDREVHSYGEKVDLLIAFDRRTYQEHFKDCTKEAIIATSDRELQKELERKKIRCFFLDLSSRGKFGNMAFAGFLFKCLGLDLNFLLQEIEEQFKEKSQDTKNKEVVREFYSKSYGATLKLPVKKKLERARHLSGSEAMGEAAIDAGLEFYFGYPMTPSTALLTYLAQRQKDCPNLYVLTPENEIAIINAALGASFSGRKVMVGTSGGGFDLMSEGMSLQGMTELPLVIHLSQRTGPGTGAPTYTSQADLNVALHSGHGDFARVVIAPGDAEEAYEKTAEAIYLAEKVQTLSIILTDKHLAESGYTQEMEKTKLKIPSRKEFPGRGIFKKNSYEHDSRGNTREDAKTIAEGMERRKMKFKTLQEETQKFVRYKVYGAGGKLISNQTDDYNKINQNAGPLLVGFGSTKGAVLDALSSPEMKEFSYLHLLYLEPFPVEIQSFLQRAKEVYVLEGNSTGQLAGLLAQKTGFMVREENKILRYDGRPFTSEYIIRRIKELRNK